MAMAILIFHGISTLIHDPPYWWDSWGIVGVRTLQIYQQKSEIVCQDLPLLELIASQHVLMEFLYLLCESYIFALQTLKSIIPPKACSPGTLGPHRHADAYQ